MYAFCSLRNKHTKKTVTFLHMEWSDELQVLIKVLFRGILPKIRCCSYLWTISNYVSKIIFEELLNTMKLYLSYALVIYTKVKNSLESKMPSIFIWKICISHINIFEKKTKFIIVIDTEIFYHYNEIIRKACIERDSIPRPHGQNY